MRTDEEKLKVLESAMLDLDAEMPIRIWVEGNGNTFAQFQGNTSQRVQLSPYEVIQLVHKAGETARRMISL